MQHKFTISILTMNRLECTKACIEAVLNGGGDFQLIVTDNGSTDGTLEYLMEVKGITLLIQNRENEGFIKPMNKAFEIAKETGSKYFVCLNNDTVPPPGWLDELVKPLDTHFNAALSGPMDGCNMVDQNFFGFTGPYIEYIEGSCLVVKIDKLKGEPLFSEYLTMAYGEDSDLSLRMREKGYSIHKVSINVPHVDRAGTVRRDPVLAEKLRGAFEQNHNILRQRWASYLLKRSFA